ncbi:MAG: GIN domain-containing protein [Ferruginibacter sp.]
MKKIFTLVALLAVIYSNAQTNVQRIVGSFAGVSAATGIQVEITQGDEESVFVNASDDAYTDKLKTVVENGVLKIFYENKDWKKNSVKNLKLKAFVKFKNIDKIYVSSGAGIITKNTITANVLLLDVSSGAQFTGALKVADFSIEQSSGAVSKITGSATNVKANLSSGTVCTATAFTAENCSATASSGAVLKMGVSGKLSVKASSGAIVSYIGNALVEKKLSSGASVKKI